MQEFIMLIGLPGSGKSALAQRYKLQDYIIFSSDEYREKLLGDRRNQSGNSAVFNLMYKNLKVALLSGSNCVLDATNTSFKSRRQVMEMIECLPNRKNIQTEAIVVNVPIEECYKRDEQREYSVGKEVIDKFYYNFQMPVFEEGFDEIGCSQEITTTLTRKFLEDKTQNNPYHQYSINRHMAEATLILAEWGIGSFDPLSVACRYHDIGKFFTETKDKEGVSHYIGHDNVGVYKLITEIPIFDSVAGGFSSNEIDTLFYINWHMHARRWIQEKTINKYRNIFGNKKVNSLLLLAECDDLARGDEEFRKKTNKENCYK